MFAPPVSKPKAKTASNGIMALRRAAPFGQRHGDADQAQMFWPLPQGEASLNAPVTTGPPGPSWNFGKIPVFSPGREQPFQRPPLPIQAKLKVGAIDDPLEHEADRVAEQVMRMPASGVSIAAGPPKISRKCDACEEEEKLQKKEAGPQAGTGEASAIVHEVLRSPGQPLDAATRAYFEPRFGQDFSQVRVHTDQRAGDAARGVAAQAFTVDEHIVFGKSQYAPGGATGRHLLAHELAHVVQQHTGGPVLQRRAANCPAAPPSPATINTMADFIALVRRVEASTMTGGDPIATARLISRTKYEGRAWDWMLPSTKGQPGVSQDRYGVGQVTADDVASLCFKLIVTVPGGGQEDPMHIIAALVANAETQAAGTGATGLSRIVRSLPASVSQRGASTWVGDVGKAAAYWMVDKPARGGATTMADYMSEDAPPHDLMADVDGVAMTATSHASSLAFFDRAKPLSENLQRFFTPAPRSGRERRFHLFCSVEGFNLEADGVTLSAAARTMIRAQVKDFALWLQSSDPTLINHVSTWGESTGYGLLLIRRQNDWQWFADQFITFAQNGLTAEGPMGASTP